MKNDKTGGKAFHDARCSELQFREQFDQEAVKQSFSHAGARVSYWITQVGLVYSTRIKGKDKRVKDTLKDQSKL